ncbi:hypothetical protein ACJQWK_02537 [Exserohilum turcicum]|uniref:Uncharacterized protein n=1 Tax=Exserohilum turcicum (strain 28A) TaxID=671987 RepID=R0JYG5_EXST2|nr:uncharacterized protein SETTUDRAFT_177580 [Exserohilum turcica Et28A]EOA85948.1 hypothetical protein SETTUDRAFT_177580 [Exserohilum turcica Et28A]
MVLPDIYPSPGSLDLGQLVQDRLKRVNQQFPALAPTTLEDFRRVADELSTISDVCQATIKRLAAQDGVYDATKALDETERALDWAVFLSQVKVDHVPAQRALLFRAHNQPATDHPGVYISAAQKIPFNDEYRQKSSVQGFIKSLGRHLGKKVIEARCQTVRVFSNQGHVVL